MVLVSNVKEDITAFKAQAGNMLQDNNVQAQ
jgi:hypothetical protein